MQANAAVEWQLQAQTTLTATYLFVDGDQLSRSIDRNIGTTGSRTFTLADSGTTYAYPFFGADRPFGNFQRVIAFESNAVSRYNGLTLELNRRFSGNVQFRAAYTLGKVEDTVPDATAVVPGNAGDDVKYASNPVDFDADKTVGNNDQRHRFVASGVYSTNGLASGREGISARAHRRLVVQRDPDGAVRPALHRAGRRRRSEQRRQHPQRHRAGHDAQSVPAALGRHLRSADRARHSGRPLARPVDLGSVQPVQPRQHHRGGHDLLQRHRHDAHAGHDLRPSDAQRRRADHAARGEVEVLGSLRFRFKVQGSGCRVRRRGSSGAEPLSRVRRSTTCVPVNSGSAKRAGDG